jgi:hypothetical protein
MSPLGRSAVYNTIGTFTSPNEMWPFQTGRAIEFAPKSAAPTALKPTGFLGYRQAAEKPGTCKHPGCYKRNSNLGAKPNASRRRWQFRLP